MEIRQSRESRKALQRKVSNLCSAFPQLESQGGTGCLSFPLGLQHCLSPPIGALESPGAARGAALIPAGGSSNSANLESLVS